MGRRTAGAVVIASLLPPTVVVEERTDDVHGAAAVLPPGEEAAVVRAVASRRTEFTTGRVCARAALDQLGAGVDAVAVGEGRAPVWPAGVVGAITHCTGFRAAAVAWASQVRSLGIDAEPHDPLPDGVLDAVSDAGERAVLAGLPAGVCWDKVLFSAKESVYKAWFPLARCWLGFSDAELTPAVDGTFTARIRIDGPVAELRGRWAVTGGLVLTAVALPV